MRCPVGYDKCHRETESKCPTMTDSVTTMCTLGETSIPVYRGEAFVVYELKQTNAEGMLKVTLSRTHRVYIKLLAERGGELDFDYGKVEESMRDSLKRHLGDLVTMGILESSPVLGYREIVHYHLTTMGRNLATSLLKQGA